MFANKNLWLFDAILQNNLKIVLNLIDSGVNINFRGDLNRTPLIHAVVCNVNKEIVMEVIKAGADVNAKDNNGSTPLMYAMQRGCETEIILTLIKFGAEVNAQDNFKRTPLMYTTCSQCKNICKNKQNVEALLNSGAIANHIDSRRNCILHLEICSHIIYLMVNYYKISLECKDIMGDTPLMMNVLRSNKIKVRTLLFLGANPNCYDVYANSALSNARDEDIILLLLYYRANLYTKNIHGKSSITELFERGRANCVLAILKHLLLYRNGIADLPLVEQRLVSDNFQSKIEQYRLELAKMKLFYISDNIPFYDFCVQKKTTFSKLINISKKHYSHRYDEIKGLFPNYWTMLIMKLKFNETDINKKDMLNKLEKVVIESLTYDESSRQLNYDCLRYIGNFLNYNQLHNLLIASI